MIDELAPAVKQDIGSGITYLIYLAAAISLIIVTIFLLNRKKV
jgi:hypothetical protein